MLFDKSCKCTYCCVFGRLYSIHQLPLLFNLIIGVQHKTGPVKIIRSERVNVEMELNYFIFQPHFISGKTKLNYVTNDLPHTAFNFRYAMVKPIWC